MMKLLIIRIIYLLPVLIAWLMLMGLPYNIKSFIFCSGAVFITYILSLYFNILPHAIKLKFGFAIYFFWLIIEIYKSAFNVICIIWRKKLKLKPIFEWIDSNQKGELGTVIYANSITLTPGTIAVDIKGGKILVHALEKDSLIELHEGRMSGKIARIIC